MQDSEQEGEEQQRHHSLAGAGANRVDRYDDTGHATPATVASTLRNPQRPSSTPPTSCSNQATLHPAPLLLLLLLISTWPSGMHRTSIRVQDLCSVPRSVLSSRQDSQQPDPPAVVLSDLYRASCD